MRGYVSDVAKVDIYTNTTSSAVGCEIKPIKRDFGFIFALNVTFGERMQFIRQKESLTPIT